MITPEHFEKLRTECDVANNPSGLFSPYTVNMLLDDLEKAYGALADIANADDLTNKGRRSKAKRIYEELRGIPCS